MKEIWFQFGPPEAPPSFKPKRVQFYKTSVCPWYLRGKCRMGNSCMYAHDQEELRHKPDLQRTRLCPIQDEKGRCSDQNCQFAHCADELRATKTFFKTKLCKFWQHGHCLAGISCRHAHSDGDLRPKLVSKKSMPYKVAQIKKSTTTPFRGHRLQDSNFGRSEESTHSSITEVDLICSSPNVRKITDSSQSRQKLHRAWSHYIPGDSPPSGNQNNTEPLSPQLLSLISTTTCCEESCGSTNSYALPESFHLDFYIGEGGTFLAHPSHNTTVSVRSTNSIYIESSVEETKRCKFGPGLPLQMKFKCFDALALKAAMPQRYEE